MTMSEGLSSRGGKTARILLLVSPLLIGCSSGGLSSSPEETSTSSPIEETSSSIVESSSTTELPSSDSSEIISVSSEEPTHPNQAANLLPYEEKKEDLKRTIFGYYPPTDRLGVQAMAEAGITDVISTPWACGYLEDRGHNYAKTLAEFGLNDYPFIGSKDALLQEDLFSPEWLKTQENVPGIYMCDEPFPTQMDMLASQVAPFEEKLAGKTFLSCLLDPGGMAFTSAWPSSVRYSDYIDMYCEKVLEKLSGPKILMGDTYPLQTVNGKPVISGHHLFTLMTWGATASKYGYGSNVCIMADDAMIFEEPTMGSLRFQVNALQAFGIQDYTIYTVDTPPSGAEEYRKAMWQNGGKTSIYNLVKQLNEENQAYSYLPLQFHYDGTAAFWPLVTPNDDIGYAYEKSAMDGLKSVNLEEGKFDVAESAILEEFDAESPALLAHYLDDKENEAFYAMNYSNPVHKGSSFFTFSFTKADHAIVLRNGTYSDFPLTGNYLTLALEAGEGAFILPYQS